MHLQDGVRLDGTQIKFRRGSTVLSVIGSIAFVVIGLAALFAAIIFSGGLPN